MAKAKLLLQRILDFSYGYRNLEEMNFHAESPHVVPVELGQHAMNILENEKSQ